MRGLTCIIANLACIAGATAADFPTRAIRIVVPFPAGGAVDVPARIVAQRFTEMWGMQAIVENPAGAGGTIGAAQVSKAAPDGHTILMSIAGTITITPGLYPKRPYDPVRDFAPVTQMFTLPFILTVHPSVPARTTKELIALAKSRGGRLNVATSGNGTDYHLAAELFKSMAGIDFAIVPYKGGAPSLIAILAGEADAGFQVISTALPHIQAKRLSVLAVSSRNRARVLPDVPTVAESALPGFESNGWWGVLAPPGTPKEIVDRLQDAVARILRESANAERFSREGFEIVTTSPEQFAQIIRDESAKWAKLIKASGLTIQ